MFKRNEGILDRVAHIGLGMVLLPAGLFLFGGWQGNVLGWLIAGLGVLALITGLTGVSIFYIPFGISTLEKEKELIAMFTSMMAGNRSCGDPGTRQQCGSCSTVDRENS